MKPPILTTPAFRVRNLTIPIALLLTSACHASDQMPEPSKTDVIQTADCPIISSKNWSAKVMMNGENKTVLSINGNIELPNPGYAVVFEEGIADRSLPPSQHFHIKTESLSGFYVQAVTPMTLEHSTPAIAKQYRSIVIHCGDQIIATINDITESR